MCERRRRIIERVDKLPDEKLPLVEEFLNGLESPAVSSLVPLDSPSPKDWPHAPLHRLGEQGAYIVTAATLHNHHLWRGPERLDLLESMLLSAAKEFGWHLEAWAVFSNHYHIVGHLPGGSDGQAMFKQLHACSAQELNRLDHAPGRTVWHNFWDTHLTYEKSYLARLNYVHQNPVKHGLVRVANQYRWCSAAWFERTATPAQVETIYSFKTDRVRLPDDFAPV